MEPTPTGAGAPPLPPFDITGPLPSGTTLLEASAGTGKTWTIASLVARYVAEGEATLDELLVVTFGRAASQELRDRVRERLVTAERTLTAPPAAATGDALLDHLLATDEAGRAERAERLRTALSTFDSATIATIHQFCQQVLRSLGVAGDTDTSARLVEDLSDLLVEVTDDLYLQQWSRTETPPFTRSQALELARMATDDLQAVLAPDLSAAELEDLQGEQAGYVQRIVFARQVRAELERRKRTLGLLGYDDLLRQLASALASGEAAKERMRNRWKVALVDEFQDTDPVQWEVFSRAFVDAPGHTMVLIGDPKQAIYAFRGGDVFTYLAATRQATRQTLDRNWRSDAALVTRVHALLGGAALGDPMISVAPVHAVREGSRLVGAGDTFRLRVVNRDHLRRGRVGVADYRQHVFADLARDVKRLLLSDATFEGRPVEPRDIAVIAQTNAQLQAIQTHLHALRVPAVVSGNESVFGTAAASEWLVLLEALEQPQRSDRVRAAALTSFLGHDAAALDVGGEELTDQLAARVREWADLLVRRGVAAVTEAAVVSGMTERLLGVTNGERLLTDLRHIGQALHQVELTEHLGPVALANWLRTQMSEEKLDVGQDRTRRLDSDAAAVQLVTVHRSKGLEYPVVYLPSLWDRWVRDPKVPLFHAPDASGRMVRMRNVGGPRSPQWRDDLTRHLAEDAGETLRLLYVALTRAQSQVVAWYAATPKNTTTSPLHRMLFGRRPGGVAVPDEWELRDADQVSWILDAWAAAGGPSWEPADPIDLAPAELPLDTRPLSVRSFDRWIDTDWRRTSYSALTSVVDHAAPTTGRALSEPEDPGLDDEPAPDEDAPDTAGPAHPVPVGLDVVSPMAELPMGTTFGSLVHAVLEHADPAAPAFDGDFLAELRHHTREQLSWWAAPVEVDALAEALFTVCSSPMGPLADDLTLREVGLSDRLRELDFELPLAGGDRPDASHGRVRLGDLVPLLEAHLPAGDPVRGYTAQLADPELSKQPLKGYLTGSIDVVLRLGEGASTRFLTVDYKTNWLGGTDKVLTAEEYRPEALDAAMAHSDYPLQALLYTVVLHRYLRWRLVDYDPERHLGGVLYLYLRGMCGPDTPRVDGAPCGVFAWRPPVPLVEAVSALLDGRVGAMAEGGSRG